MQKPSVSLYYKENIITDRLDLMETKKHVVNLFRIILK